jgi:hypothetical protein
MAVVAGVVEVAAGRAEAAGSCCAGGPVKAGAMVGLGWLRRLGSVGARRGYIESRGRLRAYRSPDVGIPRDWEEPAGDDIGVVEEVDLWRMAYGAGAGEIVIDIDGLVVGPVLETATDVAVEQADRSLFDDAQGY